MDPIWFWLIALLLVLVGLAGTILPALPGLPFVFGGLWLGAWIDGYAQVSGWLIVVLGILTAVAMGIDFMAGVLGAKKVGASKEAIIGASIGAIVGIFFGFIGIFVGPFIGAFAGEYLARGRLGDAGKVGLGTWLGIVVGAAVKIGTAFLMLALFAFAYFVT